MECLLRSERGMIHTNVSVHGFQKSDSLSTLVNVVARHRERTALEGREECLAGANYGRQSSVVGGRVVRLKKSTIKRTPMRQNKMGILEQILVWRVELRINPCSVAGIKVIKPNNNRAVGVQERTSRISPESSGRHRSW